MFRITSHVWVVVVGTGLCLTAVTKAGLVDMVDQSQETLNGNLSIPYFSPMGQSFVPALAGLDFVELMMTDNTTAPTDGLAHVNVREGTMDGAILGTSDQVFLADCFNFPSAPCGAGGPDALVRFDFADRVPLLPEQTYVLEVIADESSFGIGVADSDTYASGTLITIGEPDSGLDLWFREGIVPEPASLLLLAVAASAALCRRRAGRAVACPST